MSDSIHNPNGASGMIRPMDPLRHGDPGSSGDFALARMPQPAEGTDVYRRILRTLRGRYGLVTLLGLAGLGVGAFLGWHLGKPVYTSEGLVRIAYAIPHVMQETDQNRPMDMFEAFMQSQQALISSRRLADMAAQDPTWKTVGKFQPAQIIESYASDLKVEYKPRTEHLKITFVDSNPVYAAAAVRSLVSAYAKVYNGRNDELQRQRLQALADRVKMFMSRLDEIHGRIRGIAAEFGSDQIDPLYQAAVQEVTKVESAMVDMQLASARLSGMNPAEAALTLRTTDPVMQEYLTEQRRLEGQLAELKARGLGDQHPGVQRTQRMLTDARERVRRYASAQATSADTPAQAAGSALPTLTADPGTINRLYESVRRQMATLGAKRLEIDSLKAEEAKINLDLAETTRRMNILQMESSLGGRLEIISSGEVPLSPTKDYRIYAGVAGAAVGGGLPVGVLVLIGLCNFRYRYCDETETDIASRAPLLGILPTLPEQLDDAEAITAAAQCVHQIRVRLQVNNDTGQHPVYLVTSSAAGEGKTSVCLAMGLSFAASGCRTLVVDCDLVGQRLTHSFQADELPGLNEALTAGSLAAFVRKTSAGVWVLPVGKSNLLDACTLSAASLRRLLAEARQHFDVVLIDSGPVLGSVEAALIASEVDGVIFTITRGQQQPLVQRAIRYLDAIGARVVGFVFNRAESSDYQYSTNASNLRSTCVQNAAVRSLLMNRNRASRFGPVVRSVSSLLRSSRGEDPSIFTDAGSR